MPSLKPPTHFDDLPHGIVSYKPKVSLDPKVYYKTQESTYERVALGPSSEASTASARADKAIAQKYHDERDLLHWIKYGKHLPNRNKKPSKSATKRARNARANQLSNALLDLVSGTTQ